MAVPISYRVRKGESRYGQTQKGHLGDIRRFSAHPQMRTETRIPLMHRPAESESFRAEVLELRTEIMLKGVLLPLAVAGWLGMAFAIGAFESEIARILTAVSFAGMLLLAFASGYLVWSGHNRVALWVCGWGSMLLAPLMVLASQGALSPLWGCAACVVVTLLNGPRAGWVSVVVSTGLAALIFSARPDFVPWAHVVLAAILSCALVFVTHVATRVLLRSMRRLNEGFELALTQADQLREQGAELALAMKSLNQTSFALARANEQMEMMVQFAEEARHSKQEFAANISHELRTPLNLIIGFSEVILYAPSTYYADHLPPKLLADIHTIYRNAQHLLKLVNDILDLSQMDVNYMSIVREPMQIEEVVRAALSDFEPLIRARGLTLSLDIEANLPELYADRTRIRQVLLNLLNNAMRFTDQGGITIRARSQESEVGRQMTDDERPMTDGSVEGSVNRQSSIINPKSKIQNPKSEIVVGVIDTGTGIAEADRQRIFEPFTQVDSSPHRKHGGSGLGLTISKRFVELHGGHMWVESEVGRGSTFYFTIPALAPTPLSATTWIPQAVRRREVGPLVVVERVPLLSRLLSRYLSGISVLPVQNPAALASVAQTACPEVIIINEPYGEAELPLAPWPPELRHTPVLRCRAAGPLLIVADGAARNGAAREGAPGRLVMSLPKPIERERLYAALAEMTRTGTATNANDPGLNEPRRAPTRTGTATNANDPGLHEPRRAPTRTATATNANDPGLNEPRRAPAAEPFRVLVVEDDEDALRLFGRLLRLAPAQAKGPFSAIVPVELNSGEEAIEYLRTADGRAIDAALLDLRLGSVTGFDVLHEMDQHDHLKQVPVCLTTGGDMTDQPLITPFVTLGKPDGLNANELLQTMAALLQVVVPGLSVSLSAPSAASAPTAPSPNGAPR